MVGPNAINGRQPVYRPELALRCCGSAKRWLPINRRRPRIKRRANPLPTVVGEFQPSLAQGVHLLITPCRLHHAIGSVAHAEQQMAQFVRHHEPQ